MRSKDKRSGMLKGTHCITIKFDEGNVLTIALYLYIGRILGRDPDKSLALPLPIS
jgi:hypothetical protein